MTEEWIKKNDIALCCIQKQEAPYIEEFVRRHLDIGFDKIVIYDDDDSDDCIISELPYIKQQINAGTLRIIRCHGIPCPQPFVYRDFYSRFSPEWVMFLDVDEFLVLNKHKTVREFVSDPMFDKCRQIHIPWKMFGDSGHYSKTEGDVVDRFTESYPPQEEQVLCKSIVRGGYPTDRLNFRTSHAVRGISPEMTASGKPSANPIYPTTETKYDISWCEPDYSVAQINHYFTKSTEEFVNKCYRGVPDQENVFIDTALYWTANERTPDREHMLVRYILENKTRQQSIFYPIKASAKIGQSNN